MAAEGQRAPVAGRGSTITHPAPAEFMARAARDTTAVKQPRPVIVDHVSAIDDLSCQLERLAALLNSNASDLAELMHGTEGHTLHRLENISMIFTLGIEKLDEARGIFDAIGDVVRADRATVAA